MNKKELVKAIADKSNVSQKNTEFVIKGLIYTMEDALSLPKQAYTPPKMSLIPLASSILNNSSGGGDGDSAMANS